MTSTKEVEIASTTPSVPRLTTGELVDHQSFKRKALSPVDPLGYTCARGRDVARL